MEASSPSTSLARLHEDPREEAGQDRAQKRRRLSGSASPGLAAPGSLANAASSLPQSSYSVDDESDGCQTPPREERSPSPGVESLNAEPVDRWAQFEDEEEEEGDKGSAAPSPSPDKRIDARDQDEVNECDAQRARSSSSRSQRAHSDDSSSRLSSVGSHDNSTSHTSSSAHAPKTNAGTSYPQYSRKRMAKGKRWSLECDEALIRFIALDGILRPWALGRSGKRGVISLLGRFSSLTNGPPAQAIYVRAHRFRKAHEGLMASVSPAAQSSPTSAWTQLRDLESLADLESRTNGHMLRSWHDQIQVRSKARNASAASSKGASALPGRKSGSAAPNSVASGSGSRRVMAGPSRLRAPLELAEVSIVAPNPVKRRASSKTPQSSARVVELQRLLERQAEKIEALSAEGQQQSQTITRQVELLQQQSDQADAQEQKSRQQARTLERIEQQLEALEALLSQRRT